MAAERPIFDPTESADLRRQVGDIARKALAKLDRELEEHGPNYVAETWAKKFKIVADQIRRDFRLDGEMELPSLAEEENADPLAKLRVVSEDEEEVA